MTAPVIQRQGYRARNAATWVRVPPGAWLSLDHSLTIRPRQICAHDVAEAYRLAKAEVRVRLPLGTLEMTLTGCGKVWLIRPVRNRENAGSNPATLTLALICTRTYRGWMSWFIRLPVKEEIAGSIPAPGAPKSKEGQANGRWQPS